MSNALQQDSALGPIGGASRGSELLDVAAAWESAHRAAQFAAVVAVRCVEEGHGAEPCVVRVVADDGVGRSLALARELADAIERAA